MIDKKKAFKISAISALAVGAIHYAAHMIIAPKIFPSANPIVVVSVVVIVTVFSLGYYGMTHKM